MQVRKLGLPRLGTPHTTPQSAAIATLDGLAGHECRMRNDRQTYFKVVRDLMHAQFDLADQELSSRLWQDVADRNLDRGRILHLLYSCYDLDHNDDLMRCSDEAYVALVDPNDP